MDYILVQKIDGVIVPRRLTAVEAEDWYHNQKDCDEPRTILDIKHNTMSGSQDPDDLDMLLIVTPVDLPADAAVGNRGGDRPTWHVGPSGHVSFRRPGEYPAIDDAEDPNLPQD